MQKFMLPVLTFALSCSLAIHLILTGCTAQTAPPPNPLAASGSPPTAASTQPLFFEFPDVPIPQELSLVQGDSYVYQHGKLRAGLLTLRGRVDLQSVVNFFQLAMPRHGWTPKGGFTYWRAFLLFEKPDRICVINMYEKFFFTYVEVYIAPTGEI
jgi:hypothetical protein